MSKGEHKQTPTLGGRLSGKMQKAWRQVAHSPRARGVVIGAAWVVIVVAVAGFGSRALIEGLVSWETGRVFSEQPLATPRAVSPPKPQAVQPSHGVGAGTHKVQVAATPKPTPVQAGAAAAPAVKGDVPSVSKPQVAATPTPAAAAQTAPVLPAAVDLAHLYWPVQGRIAETNGWVRDPYTRAWHYEPGVVLEAAAGDEIHAALAGTVSDVGADAHGAERVNVKDADGWTTTYSGNFAPVVTVGQQISRGAVIGRLMGSEPKPGGPEVVVGPNGEDPGAWLEFVLQHDNAVVDPRPYAPK